MIPDAAFLAAALTLEARGEAVTYASLAKEACTSRGVLSHRITGLRKLEGWRKHWCSPANNRLGPDHPWRWKRPQPSQSWKE